MSQQDPGLYNQLTSQLQPEEQQVIKAAIEKADQLAIEQRNADQQAALQAMAAGGDATGVPQPHTNGAS